MKKIYKIFQKRTINECTLKQLIKFCVTKELMKILRIMAYNIQKEHDSTFSLMQKKEQKHNEIVCGM